MIVEGAKKVFIEVPGKPEVALTHVSSYDEALDFIEFDIPWEFGNQDKLGNSDILKSGDKLYVIGSPRGLEQTITEGILSGRRVMDGVSYLQPSVPVSPGSSGSPVINESGEVVGLVVGGLKDSQQINFAVGIYDMVRKANGVPLSAIKFKGEKKTPTEVRKLVSSSSPEVLKGLGGVAVLAEDLPPGAIERNLKREDLELVTTSKLKANGVRVLADDERFKTPGSPYLYVRATPRCVSDVCFYSVRVELSELVILERDEASVVNTAVVWEQSMTGVRPDSGLASGVREAVGELVDLFVKDYLKANSKD